MRRLVDARFDGVAVNNAIRSTEPDERAPAGRPYGRIRQQPSF
jgi:hypothetical protein